jgi:RHS repeat-associated protein
MSTLQLVRAFVFLSCVSVAAVVQGAPPPAPPLPSVKDPPAPLKPPDEPILPTSAPSAYLPGSGQVSPTGDYSYSIPVMLPRGRAGMQPSLSIEYSSRRRDQSMGLGWSIGGLSVVHRCAKSVAVDGIADGVDLDDDALCLDGQKLVYIGSSQYRTERESFRYIHGSIEGMTVRHKDGTTATYTPIGDALPITSLRDRVGNEIRYRYESGKSMNVTAIEYTAQVGSDVKAPYLVEFDYKTREYPLTAYAGAQMREQDQALDAIRVSGPNGAAWKYSFEYDRSPATTQLRLVSIQLCSYGTCTQKRVFEYEDAKPTWATRAWFRTNYAVDDYNLQVLDFDGDGRDDVMIGAQKMWRAHFVANSNGEIVEGALTSNNAFSDDRFAAVDVDRDGKTEVVALDASGKRWRLYRWNGSAFAEDPTFPLVELYPNLSTHPVKEVERERPVFADLDGDGLPEMVRGFYFAFGPAGHIDEPNTRVYENVNGVFQPPQDHSAVFFPPGMSMFSPAPDAFLNYPIEVPIWAADVRGDGRQSIVRRSFQFFESGGFLEVRKNDQGSVVSERISYASPDALIHADVNGDGLREEFSRNKGEPPAGDEYFAGSFNTGSVSSLVYNGDSFSLDVAGGFPNIETHHWLVGDLNGDEREEIVTYGKFGVREAPKLHVLSPVEEAERMVAHDIDVGFDAPGDTHQSGHRLITTRLGDFDGDGLTDFLVAAHRCSEYEGAEEACDYWLDDVVYFHVVTRTNQQSDRLLRVKDDAAERTREEIVWEQWSAPPDFVDTCSYPDQCLHHGFPVVREHRSVDPSTAGELESTFYTYYAPRTDLRGRGFLGFQKVVAWMPQRPMEVTTQYLPWMQEGGVYPYATSPASVSIVVPILEAPPFGRKDTEKPTTATARVTKTFFSYDWATSEGTANWTFPTYSSLYEWEEEVKIDWHDWEPLHITDVSAIDEVPLRRVDTSYQYDGIGNPTKTTTVVQGGTVTEVENVYSYEAGNWPVAHVETTYERSARSQTDPFRTRKTEYDYDPTNGLLVETRLEPGQGALSVTENLTRDPATGLVSLISRFAVGEDPRHSAIGWDETGAHVVYRGDSLGNASWRAVWPELGVPTVIMNTNANTSMFQYDGLGRMRTSSSDGGGSASYWRQLENAAGGLRGLVESAVADTGAETYSVKDEAGRTKASCSRSFGTGEWACSYVTYDVNGNVWESTRPGPEGTGGPATTTTHDTLGRPLEATPPTGPSARWIHSFYATESIEPNGNHHLTQRDFDLRVVKTTDYADTAATVAVETEFQYEEFDLLRKVIDAQGNELTQYHDLRGRRTGITDPDMGLRTFVYNGFDELKRVTYPDSTKREWDYDAAGRVKEIRDRNAANVLTGTTSSVWDTATYGQGQLAKTISADGYTETRYEYDTFGRSSKTTWKVGTESFTFQTLYDSSGRQKSLLYPKVQDAPQVTLDNFYDDYGFVKQTKVRLGTDIVQIRDIWEVIDRMPDGQLASGKLGNGVTTQRVPDMNGRISWLWWGANNATVDFHHEYDGSGNLTKRWDDTDQRTENFEYDGLNRLKHAELKPPSTQIVPPLKTEFEYDAVGNAKKVWVEGKLAEDNTYYALGKPHALANDGFGTTFQYDSRGRLLNDGTRTYTYTPFDLPKTITRGATTWQFRYDAAENRVVKTDGSTTVLTVGDLLERRTTPTGVTHVYRLPGPDGMSAELVFDKANVTTRFLSTERLGSVAMVTDDAGNLVERQYFAPFGQRVKADGKAVTSAATPVGFTQHKHDDEIGLIDMRGRIYDPQRRRFTTPDDVVPATLSGQSYNRYSYVFQNPLNYTDPSGHDPDTGDPIIPIGLGIVVPIVGWAYGVLVNAGDVQSTGKHRGNGTDPPPPPPAAPPALQTNLQNYGGGVEDPSGTGRQGFTAPQENAATVCGNGVTGGCIVVDNLDKALEEVQDIYATGAIAIGTAAAIWYGVGVYTLAAAGDLAGAGVALDGVFAGLGVSRLYDMGRQTIGNATDDPEVTATKKVIDLQTVADGALQPLRGSRNPNTRDAAARGSELHRDKPGHLPDQLRARYPDTNFEFKPEFKPGQDVTYTGGKHPSDYPGSTWPTGVNYGDFKPGTKTGWDTFKRDQKTKWPDPTVYLPYDPATGKLL